MPIRCVKYSHNYIYCCVIGGNVEVSRIAALWYSFCESQPWGSLSNYGIITILCGKTVEVALAPLTC